MQGRCIVTYPNFRWTQPDTAASAVRGGLSLDLLSALRTNAALAQVRSCSLDTWLPGQVAFMTATGNAVANAYWAGRRGAAARLPASSPGLAAHLERKVGHCEGLKLPAYDCHPMVPVTKLIVLCKVCPPRHFVSRLHALHAASVKLHCC